MVTVLVTVGFLLVAAPLFDAFEGGSGAPQWYVVGGAALVVALSAAADVAAALMLRGRRWARWVLIGLSVFAALGGVMLAYYVVTLALTAAGVAVVVLLLLPDARKWFGRQRTIDPGSGERAMPLQP